MQLIIVLALIISLPLSAHVIPVENLAPKVRFLNISSNGVVKYQLRDGGIRLIIRSKENKLAKMNPELLSSLLKSYKNQGSWVVIESHKSIE